MKNKTILIFLSHCLLFLSCNKEEECNIKIDIGGNKSVSFFLKEFYNQTHSNYPPDFAADISETDACDVFYIDSSRTPSYVTICYMPILDSLYLDKSEKERLEGSLISSFNIGQNDTDILSTEISDKKNVYTVYTKIKRNDFYHAALYKYSKNKLVFFAFHNFKNIEEIDQIVESIKFY